MRVLPLGPFALLAAVTACHPATAGDARLERLVGLALVKVYVTANPPDVQSPWQRAGIQSATGSGVILEGQRILTAAHVVADRVSVEVKRANGTRRFPARVEHVGHACDLALLRVDDPAFFHAARPLALGGLPELRDRVDVYGFPEGGDRIAVTTGVVSRVEVGEYVHSADQLLLVQIDAAINSGNSGGPVVGGGRLVGIAAETLEGAENIGYMIPTPIIRHFLDDVADGRFDGFPRLGVEAQPLENGAHRAALGLDETHGGVRVTRVNHGSAAWDVLRAGDVLLAVDGVEIGRDATVALRGDERVHFSYPITTRFVGDRVALTVWRGGAVERREVRLSTYERLVPGPQYDRPLPYLIWGGMVFQPLGAEMAGFYGPWPGDLGHWADFANLRTAERGQVIVLTQVLAHAVNQGYDELGGRVVERVGAVGVRDLAHLAELLDARAAGFVELTLDDGTAVVLDAAAARASEAELLEAYGINAARVVPR